MSWKSLVNRAVKIGINEGMKFLKESQSKQGDRREPRSNAPRPNGQDSAPHRTGESGQRPGGTSADAATDSYPGDFQGTVRAAYSPDLDGNADPGEVVWGWIPFEEDHSQGKDRPSLVVGKDGHWVLVLMLSSKDHIAGGFGEVREDRNARWMNIGSGDWDRQGRPSEIRLDRVIRLDPDSIRREGAIMPQEVFEHIAANL